MGAFTVDFDPETVAGERRELKLPDFADLFGTTPDDIPADLQAKIAAGDFRYVDLAGDERDRVLIDVLSTIDSGQMSLAGAAGKARWEKGWSENLDAFVESGDLSQLVPKYIRPRQPVRLNQNYVMPYAKAFELDWYEVFRPWFLRKYLGGFDHVFEFGCGPAFNLAALAQLNPERHYVGLDWAEASAKIVDHMSSRFGWNMQGKVFDFFKPDYSLDVPANSAFLTVGALEQTNTNWGDFLEFMLAKKPACVFHIEPIREWYADDNLVDYAAIHMHEARQYWTGFPQKIDELEKAGRIQVLKRKRSFFGSLFIEGYSQLIWKPVD